MSLSKATKALKPLLAMAEEYHDLVTLEGEKSDREIKRIRQLAGDIYANWETVAQYQDSIERIGEQGPRTDAEESTLKLFSKRIRKLGSLLWKARGVDDLVVKPNMQKALKRIRGDVSRWKRLVKKAPKRTASADPAGGDKGADKSAEKAQGKQPLAKA